MIIGLIGYKQVGKSTAAKYLANTYEFSRHNFKDGLVSEMKQNLPNTLDLLAKEHKTSVTELFDYKPPIMRALMQEYGTEVRRHDDPKYWVKKWINGIPENNNVVVDDVRFINEAKAVSYRGGVLVRLKRDDITDGGDHASEVEQDKIVADFTIICGKGQHDILYRKLDSIYEAVKSSEV